MSAIVRKNLVGLLAIAFVVMAPYAAWSQQWDFTEMPADWTLYGDATHDAGNGWIQLTPNSGDQFSSAFYNVPSNTATWKAEFDIYCGANDGGADGATFAWVTSPGVGLEANGGQMAFLTGLDGYCIEFDNYLGNDSTPGVAETENHVGVSKGNPGTVPAGETLMINSDIPDL